MKAAAAIAVLALTAACHPAAKLPDYGTVPEFSLTDQTGASFTRARLEDKLWVADFIYTSCPGICPRMTSQMREVQDAVRKLPDVRLVSFTVDPATDVPARLAAYAQQHGALPAKWFFLTGDLKTLQMLDRDAFKLGNVDGSLNHSTRFVLMDRRYRIRGYYDTSEPGSVGKLIDDIASLREDHT